jgi:two-component system sensor histidine kinase AtoS
MKRGVSRAIALRLAAGLLPSILAVALVVSLFYYGEYERAAPRAILIAAAVLTLASIVVAWANATYFAERLARLARSTSKVSGGSERTDEFDRIERAVGKLDSALTAAEAERARSDAMAAARLHEQATMLAGVVNDTLAQLDQVRLPLQILLESPFGDLNENQEELLRDARAAADAIDLALRRLGQVADIDREALPVQRELVQINDVVRSVLPVARAVAERRGARTETALEPGLPRVVADRARLAEALSLFLADSAGESSGSTSLRISTARSGSSAVIRIAPVSASARARASTPADAGPGEADGASGESSPLILASRLISAQGGEVGLDDGALMLRVG